MINSGWLILTIFNSTYFDNRRCIIEAIWTLELYSCILIFRAEISIFENSPQKLKSNNSFKVNTSQINKETMAKFQARLFRFE